MKRVELSKLTGDFRKDTSHEFLFEIKTKDETTIVTVEELLELMSLALPEFKKLKQEQIASVKKELQMQQAIVSELILQLALLESLN